ncbi:G-protein coupled receptor GRL101-like [Diadema setosum]|uniref:G-protein coupled receptor GRL101-like n=1 Tax=Diadema setosum TaxID=31175 RepID=UPI003B3BD4E0
MTHAYTDSFGFCCLIPDGAVCVGYVNFFSSCDDLLKDVSLRAFMWLLGLSALVGNFLAFSARIYRRRKAGQNSIQIFMISNLALADLLMGLYMIIIAIADVHFRGRYAQHAEEWTNSAICKISGFTSVLSSEASVFLLMLISIDRFLSVVFPFKTELHLKATPARLLVCAVWLMSLFLSLIPALPVPYFEGFYGKSSVCLALPLTNERGPGWEYSLIVFIATNFVCFMITFVCYFSIFVNVRKSHRRIVSLGAASTAMLKEQVQMTTKMALVVGTDFACWMPIILMGILASSKVVEIPADIYAWTAVFILPLNSALNPYLYTLSTIMQRRKQSENKEPTNITETSTSMELSPQYERLGEHRIILQETVFARHDVEPIGRFIKRHGGCLNDHQEALITRDLRKAQYYLKSLGVEELSLSSASIVVEKDKCGEMSKALFVISNRNDIQKLTGSTCCDHGGGQLDALLAHMDISSSITSKTNIHEVTA